jgi:hypothetical protein
MAKKKQGGPPKEHQFSSTNQPKNRGRKKNLVTSYLKEFLQAQELSFVIEYRTEKGQMKKLRGTLKSDSNIAKVVAIQLLTKAAKGDLKAIKELMDRTEGRSIQKQEVTGAGGAPLNGAKVIFEVPEIPVPASEEKDVRDINESDFDLSED